MHIPGSGPGTMPVNQPVPGSQPTASGSSIHAFPSISHWLAYLDAHPQRRREDLSFVSFTDKFKDGGWDRLDQLVLDPIIMPVPVFRVEVGMSLGVATSVLAYAQEDIEAIRTGKLQVPLPTNGFSN